MKYWMICFFIALSVSSIGQIVNIESQRIRSDTTGWLGNAGASFALTKYVQQVISTNANAHVEYKTKKDLYLFIASYSLLKTSSEDLTNNMFYHLRYNRKLNAWLRWEVFTQLQQNAVTGIGLRALAGTGPRWKITENKKFRLYAATAVMYEYEQDKTTPPAYHNEIRNSSYVSVNFTPNSTVQLISTVFYQPLLSNVKDFRVSNQTTLMIKTGKHLSFVTAFNYLYDAFPVINTPQVNYAISNGLTYVFK